MRYCDIPDEIKDIVITADRKGYSTHKIHTIVGLSERQVNRILTDDCFHETWDVQGKRSVNPHKVRKRVVTDVLA